MPETPLHPGAPVAKDAIRGEHRRVVVFIRCHTLPEFVADTIDAVRHFAETQPLIVCTVDRNVAIEETLRPAYPDVRFFTSQSDCGWGGGLWRLFCEAATWLLVEQGVSFDYLWNIDYDLIPIYPGWDSYFHKRFDAPNIGQIGRHNANSNYWNRQIRKTLPKLKSTFREHGVEWPKDYKPGDHVAGACGVFKGTCVARMYAMGLFKQPFSDLGAECRIADDPMLSLMTNAAGYRFREMGDKAYIKWRMTEDYRKIPGREFMLYHPTKLTPGNKPYSVRTELECRNFFRQLRGQGAIRLLKGTPATAGPTTILC